MTESLIPTFSHADVNELLTTHFGLTGSLKPLPGEFDQNLRLTTDDCKRYIVKFLSGVESRPELAMQNAAMVHLSSAGFPVPSVLGNRDKQDVTVIHAEGRDYLLRVLSFLPGQFLTDVPAARRSDALFRNLGRFIGQLDVSFATFDHPRPDGQHNWDLAHGYMKCRTELHLLPDHSRTLVNYFLEHYRTHVMPLVGDLPRSFIHNDINDHNVLVDGGESPREVAGLIDFGDMVYSQTINDLAIAAAYALMGQADPSAALCELVAGYHCERPVRDAEFAALFGLIALRLSTTICNAAVELEARPENEYMQVSLQPALKLLKALQQLAPAAVERQLRATCELR